MSKPIELSPADGIPVKQFNMDDDAVPVNKEEKSEATETKKKKKPFDPSQVRDTYGPEQWEAKKQWYFDKIQNELSYGNIHDLATYKAFLVQFDAVNTVLNMDYMKATRNLEKYEDMLDHQEKKIYNDVKRTLKESNEKQKDPTINEIAGEIFRVISEHKIGKGDKSLYDIIEIYKDRISDLKAFREDMASKNSIIPNYTSILKMEFHLENYVPSVPDTPDRL